MSSEMLGLAFVLVLVCAACACAQANDRVRIRDLGVRPGVLEPGSLNAITDVEGVTVGHRTIVEGDARTGVTAILPPMSPTPSARRSAFSRCASLGRSRRRSS